ncbi:hypothetical protein KIPB_003196, partial [Kipferlia bialata]|eukprot:g3196.t1
MYQPYQSDHGSQYSDSFRGRDASRLGAPSGDAPSQVPPVQGLVTSPTGLLSYAGSGLRLDTQRGMVASSVSQDISSIVDRDRERDGERERERERDRSYGRGRAWSVGRERERERSGRDYTPELRGDRDRDYYSRREGERESSQGPNIDGASALATAAQSMGTDNQRGYSSERDYRRSVTSEWDGQRDGSASLMDRERERESAGGYSVPRGVGAYQASPKGVMSGLGQRMPNLGHSGIVVDPTCSVDGGAGYKSYSTLHDGARDRGADREREGGAYGAAQVIASMSRNVHDKPPEKQREASMTPGQGASAPRSSASTRFSVPAHILEDGYQWRKYGQKLSKSATHPTCYFKCAHPNCPVKRQIYHDPSGSGDQGFASRYQGTHSHPAPLYLSCEVTSQAHLAFVATRGSEFDYSPGVLPVDALGDHVYNDRKRQLTRKVGERVSVSDLVSKRVEGEHVRQLKVTINSPDVDPLKDCLMWRKYGQKRVKKASYLKAYFKCAVAR